jgi:dihydroflavonol-4-reductase
MSTRPNNTLRQRVSRLVRDTLAFSKKLANHIGAIKYFICHYNLTRAAALLHFSIFLFQSTVLQRGFMNKILITGATSFLGYHVTKLLNERGIRPRVLELEDSKPSLLQRLDVDPVEGHIEDSSSLQAACDGVDTVLHLAFKVKVGSGAPVQEQMHQVNVLGTRRVLDVAAGAGVKRVVMTSSVGAVGINRVPKPLDERADWALYRFDLPYVMTRRQAEEEALAKADHGLQVVVVNPSFTMGPDDFVGAPANQLLKKLSTGKLRFTIPTGLNCLDVRDFADGMLRAAEQGQSGRRYILSAHNVTLDELLVQAATIAGVQPPRWRPPFWLAYSLLTGIEWWSKLRRKPAPIDRSLLQIWGRYAWYNNNRARTELGWEPRPLQQTLEDTLGWLRESGSSQGSR